MNIGLVLMEINAASLKSTALIVAGVLVVVAAVNIIIKGLNGEIRDAFKTTAIILIAALVIALGSHLEEVGNWLFSVVFS
jgi:hypothetical protein